MVFQLMGNHVDYNPAAFAGRIESSRSGTSFDHVDMMLANYREVAREHLAPARPHPPAPAARPVVPTSR